MSVFEGKCEQHRYGRHSRRRLATLFHTNVYLAAPRMLWVRLDSESRCYGMYEFDGACDENQNGIYSQY